MGAELVDALLALVAHGVPTDIQEALLRGGGYGIRPGALSAVVEPTRRYREALERIANGDGYYGAQAYEYKKIARNALRLPS